MADYHRAAVILWGEAGDYAVSEYQRINDWLFSGQLPPLPIVIGITAYGRCIGLTRSAGSWDRGLPRITVASNLFSRGRNEVTDVLIHEMTHARLMLDGQTSDHNGTPGCAEITRLSPLVVGHQVKARPVNPRRIDGKVVREALPGHLDRKALARWPQSLRPPGWDPGEPIDVETH